MAGFRKESDKYNENKYKMNQEMLAEREHKMQTGEYKPDDMKQGITNGLMGK